MKKLILRITVLCSLLLAFSLAANAQKVTVKSQKKSSNVGVTILKGTGKAAVIVVGTSAKIAWGTTKFIAKDIARPLLVRVAPRMAKLMLKSSGVVAKRALPLAVKLSVL